MPTQENVDVEIGEFSCQCGNGSGIVETTKIIVKTLKGNVILNSSQENDENRKLAEEVERIAANIDELLAQKEERELSDGPKEQQEEDEEPVAMSRSISLRRRNKDGESVSTSFEMVYSRQRRRLNVSDPASLKASSKNTIVKGFCRKDAAAINCLVSSTSLVAACLLIWVLVRWHLCSAA